MPTGPSSNLTEPPTLLFVSVTATTVTLDLTNIPINADPLIETVVTIAYRRVGTSRWEMATERTAIGEFTISDLVDGAVYDFMAIPQEAEEDDEGKLGPASGTVRVAMGTAFSGFGLEELLLAIKEQIANVVWPGSSTKIFNDGGVYIVSDEGVAEDELAKLRFPVVLIYELGSSSGVADETPTFAIVQVGISVFNVARGDPFGTKVLMGAHRASEVVTAGAGIYDLHDAVQQQLTKMLRDSTYPVRFLSVMPSAASARQLADGRHLALKTYTISALIKELS